MSHNTHSEDRRPRDNHSDRRPVHGSHGSHGDDARSGKRFEDKFLRRLRNEIPIDWLIRHLAWPNKRRDGRFVFVCPRCGESETATKRDTNLGRCFHCETNFNPIDLTMAIYDYDFVQAVEFLTPLLRR